MINMLGAAVLSTLLFYIVPDAPIRELTCQEVATAVIQTKDFRENFTRKYFTKFCIERRAEYIGQCISADMMIQAMIENEAIITKFWSEMGCQEV